jgi:prepilin-type N-terminal cleavage/methylation domain-containing protein
MRQNFTMHQRGSRCGFTLIEVLMVIAIIGILVGLLVPAVNFAWRSVQQRAIAVELLGISKAVEDYRNDKGDYPPDGADPALFTRHLRKAFPQIANSEIQLVTGNTDVANVTYGVSGGVMDPSEALVFFLGGFSDDPVYPISGVGGPIYLTDSNGNQVTSDGAFTTAQYNLDRNNGLYDFSEAQLSVVNTTTADGVPITASEDGDLLPAYRPRGRTQPFVYFDSRTYQQTEIANRYSTSDSGIVYPYRSTEINTKYAPPGNTVEARNKYFRFVNPDSFQLISAGLDDHFGGVEGLFFMFRPSASETGVSANSGDSLDLVGSIPSGQSHPTPQYTRFRGPNAAAEQDDNVANFSEGILADSLDN